jgi:hypothetical protein
MRGEQVRPMVVDRYAQVPKQKTRANEPVLVDGV